MSMEYSLAVIHHSKPSSLWDRQREISETEKQSLVEVNAICSSIHYEMCYIAYKYLYPPLDQVPIGLKFLTFTYFIERGRLKAVL